MSPIGHEAIARQTCPVHSRVRAEAKRQIVVAAGFKQGERALEMAPRLDELAGELTRHPANAIGDAGLGRIVARLATSLRNAAAWARIDGNSPRT